MSSTPATWKIVTFGTALAGLGVAGVGIAAADDGDPSQPPPAVSVAADDRPGASPGEGTVADASADTSDTPDDATPDDVDTPDDATPDDVDTPDDDTPETDTPDTDD